MNWLLRHIVGSRSRVALSFSAGLVPLLVLAMGASDWIRNSSTSPSSDLLLITTWMLMALLVATLGAILLGDIIFGTEWRAINILGERPSDPGTDDSEDPSDTELERVGAAIRTQTLPFSVLIVLVLGALVFLSHSVSSGFFTWYGRYGYATSTLRGDNAERKIAVLREMTRARDDRLVDLTHMMDTVLDDETSDPGVRTQAIWSLGEVSRRMVRSLELMERGTPGGGWERDLHAHLVATIQPKLMEAFKAGPPLEEGKALIYALGALRVHEALPRFSNYLGQPEADPQVVQGILQAVAGYRDPDRGVPVIVTMLASSDPEIAGIAAWAVGELYGLGTGTADEALPDETLVRLLQSSLPGMPFATQCVVLDTLVRIRSERLTPTLFALFDQVEPPDKRCARVTMERPFQSPTVICKEEEFREKIVQALAAVAEGNSQVMSWLRNRSQDENVAEGLRHDMQYILDVLRTRRTPD